MKLYAFKSQEKKLTCSFPFDSQARRARLSITSIQGRGRGRHRNRKAYLVHTPVHPGWKGLQPATIFGYYKGPSLSWSFFSYRGRCTSPKHEAVREDEQGLLQMVLVSNAQFSMLPNHWLGTYKSAKLAPLSGKVTMSSFLESVEHTRRRGSCLFSSGL